MTDMTHVPCKCGGQKTEIIGYTETEQGCTAIRRGWYCFKCRGWEDAILRERTVDENDRRF